MDVPDIKKDIAYLKDLYLRLIKILPSFDITNSKVLPYGLKPHTRSISWLVEQVISQQTKYNKRILDLSEVDFDMPDTCLHDCDIKTNEKTYHVNIKTHNVGGKENKNDIAAVEKLYMQYSSNPSYDVIYVCLGIHFNEITISFDKDYIEVFCAQVSLPIYINPRNDKIQAFYRHTPQIRSRKDFLKLLQEQSRSIILKDK
jgi:hypothetical protein